MAANTEWEEFPTYYELADSTYQLVVKLYQESLIKRNESHPAASIWRDYNITTYDILFVVLMSIIWTVFRRLASEKIFKPLAQYYALTPTNQRKMPESAWKFLYYLCAWSYSLYVVVLSGRYLFFQKPSTVWEGWNLEDALPADIYLMYITQCGFYLHSLYATLFMDTWRKDSLAMIFHHVLTLSLITISYSIRYHNVGALVFLTHDIIDILLEFCKLNVYFKIQRGKLIKKHELFANAAFMVSSVTWFVSRLYCYPLRVLYTVTYHVQKMKLEHPCPLLSNSLLWILQILNIYWFLFIIPLLYQVATGQVREIDDIREYDIEEKLKLSTKSSSSANGTGKTNSDNGNAVIIDKRIRFKKAD